MLIFLWEMAKLRSIISIRKQSLPFCLFLTVTSRTKLFDLAHVVRWKACMLRELIQWGSTIQVLQMCITYYIQLTHIHSCSPNIQKIPIWKKEKKNPNAKKLQIENIRQCVRSVKPIKMNEPKQGQVKNSAKEAIKQHMRKKSA